MVYQVPQTLVTAYEKALDLLDTTWLGTDVERELSYNPVMKKWTFNITARYGQSLATLDLINKIDRCFKGIKREAILSNTTSFVLAHQYENANRKQRRVWQIYWTFDFE